MTRLVHVARTNPYPWPFDGQLDGARTALVVCGGQRALVELSADPATVSERIAATAAAIRSVEGSVLWLRHGRRDVAGRPSVLPCRGTDGWQLAIEPDSTDVVVDVGGWDGCFSSDLDHELRHLGSTAVVLAGFASELTVDSTVRTLNDRGHECLVLTDGCAPIDPHLGARAHASLTMSGGIFGALGTVDALLDALALATSSPTHVPTTVEVPA